VENHAKARPLRHPGLRLREADEDPVGRLRAVGGLDKVEQVGYLDSRRQDATDISPGY
jgi:hypothetical protein